MVRATAFNILAALALSAAAPGQSPDQPKPQEPADIKPLTIGDPAPPIEITHWIKGTPIKNFESGKVYVVEFWATWCGPCRASMPHISEVQEQYKDYGVSFVGVSDEELPTVVKFLASSDKEGKLWYDKVGYTLATDPDESVKNAYFTAAGQSGIPTAFIVGKDGAIEWIGHPMGIDKPLESVVKDSWDRGEFKADWEKQAAGERARMQAMGELRQARTAKDWPRVMQILDDLIEKNDGDPGLQMQKFTVLLRDMDQPEKAYAFGREFVEQNQKSAGALNMIAWFIVDEKDLKHRDLDLAMQAATKATELTNEQDAAILDTLARVYYEKGELNSAVRLQKKAVALDSAGEMKEELEATLKKYEDELNK